jgi:hypothetical protein
MTRLSWVVGVIASVFLLWIAEGCSVSHHGQPWFSVTPGVGFNIGFPVGASVGSNTETNLGNSR